VSLRVVVSAAVMGVVVLLGPVVHAAGPYPPPPASGGQGQVDDSRVEAGECVIFSGDGFKPGTTVTIRDNGKVVGTAPVAADGTFSKRICFDTDAKPGRHTLTATGVATDGRPLTVSAVVFVTGVSQRPGSGPGSGPAPGTGAGAATGSPTPVATPSPGSTPEETSSPAPVPGSGPQASPDTSGMGLTGWLIVLGLFALLALLSGLLLLLGRRRRDEERAAA
jgi:hypothetical protein